MEVTFTKQKPIAGEVEAAPEAPKPVEQTQADLAELAKSAMTALGYGEAEPPVKPGKEPKVEPVPPEKTDKEKEAEAAAAAVPPAPKPKAAPKVDAKAIAREVSDEVVARLRPPEAAKPEPNASTAFNNEDTHTRDVVAIMSEKPDGKHLAAELDVFLTKEAQYRDVWAKKNPGKEFNPEGQEHSEFYEANEPKYDETAWGRAEAKLEARQEIKRERDIQNAAQHEVQTRQTVETAAETATTTAVKELVAAAMPEIKDFNGDFSKIVEDDPFAARVLQDSAAALKALIGESHRLLTPELRNRPDGNNPLHREVLNRVYTYETEIANLPAGKQTWNGRQFATLEDFSHMTPVQQKQHWTLWNQPQLLTPFLKRDFTKMATDQITLSRKDFERIAKKRGFTPGQVASETTPNGNGHEAATSAASAGRVASPNTSSGADLGVVEPGAVRRDGKLSEMIDAALFG